MSKFRFYITCIKRHAKYGNRRQALWFALHHWRFWQGAELGKERYTHIGQ